MSGFLKAVMIAVLSAMLSTFAGGCAADRKPVLLLVRNQSYDKDLYLEGEVGVMVESLNALGVAFRVASPDGAPLAANGRTFEVDVRFADVNIKDYSALVVPCMGAGRFPVPPEMIAILKKAHAANMIIAAQHSEEIFWPSALDLYVSRARSPGEVIVDGTFITSYNTPGSAKINHKPADTVALIDRLHLMLGN